MNLPNASRETNAPDFSSLQAQANRASKLLRSLSHETRLSILCMLSEQEMSVSEIEEIVGLPQATVSQQLARLRLDDLVVTRREGRQVYYRIANEDIKTIIDTLHELFCKPTNNR
ncbi:MAG: metalloregulator ArsR/SmtB family transcription factor [Gammaproteobacteria bacterium]|nr:metalloregulator ArsR/SmtB family transcription factor [Gammaproteobacteria bacterium]